MAWTDQLIHFIDFEGSLASGIVEYGVVSWHAGAVTAARTRFCRAVGQIRPEDTLVHGLSTHVVASAPPMADDFALFADLRSSGPFAAHFANAESSLLKSVWPYPRESPDFARVGGRVLDWGPWIDTGRLYPQLFPSLGTARLEDLIDRCGLQNTLNELAQRYCPRSRRHYHAALYDALAGALLLGRLASEPLIANQSMSWLLSMSTLDPDKRDTLNQPELF